MIVVKRPRSWSVQLAVHGILAAGYLSDAAVFLISTVHAMGFVARYVRTRPASSGGKSEVNGQNGAFRREVLITRLPSHPMGVLLPYVILSSQSMCH